MDRVGIAFLLFITACCFSVPGSAAEPMVVSYLKLDDFDVHYRYRYQLIEQILEITRPEFGSYQLKPYTSLTSSIRYGQLLSEGQQLNLLWASPGTPIAKADAVIVPVDILKGLLGYRVCLINETALPNLNAINDLESFGKIKIGQALWPDREVYRFNKVAEIDAPNFSALFKMLGAKRFDCIPLGIDEVEQVYQDKKLQYPFLAIDSHLLIYYQYPVYFYVSKKHPELAKRITLGLQKMQNNGDFNKLFLKFHAQDMARLDVKKRILVCLQSPYIKEPQCTQPPGYPDGL
jgi:hypothetical protein